jgi:hypothetical protein
MAGREGAAGRAGEEEEVGRCWRGDLEARVCISGGGGEGGRGGVRATGDEEEVLGRRGRKRRCAGGGGGRGGVWADKVALSLTLGASTVVRQR